MAVEVTLAMLQREGRWLMQLRGEGLQIHLGLNAGASSAQNTSLASRLPAAMAVSNWR